MIILFYSFFAKAVFALSWNHQQLQLKEVILFGVELLKEPIQAQLIDICVTVFGWQQH